jgi:hypothetical protein
MNTSKLTAKEKCLHFLKARTKFNQNSHSKNLTLTKQSLGRLIISGKIKIDTVGNRR